MHTGTSTTDADLEILLDFGRAVGLVSVGPKDRPSINEDWFHDPIAALRKLPKTPEGRNNLFQLVSRLTATPGPPFLNKTWYPLVPSHPDPAVTQVQLCLVRDGDTDLGIGIKRSGPGMALSPYLYLPLLAIDSGEFLLDRPGRALRIGVALEEPLEAGGIALDGLNVDLQIEMTMAHPPRGDIKLKNLRLPGGESVPGAQADKDGYVSLLQAITSAKDNLDGWLGVALAILADKLAALCSDERTAQNVRTLGPNLQALLNLPRPGAPDSHFWQDVLSGSASPKDWFLNTLSTPASTKAWLETWFCLLHGRDVTTLPAQPPAPDVSVSGPSGECFSIPLFRSAAGYALDVQLVYENDGTALHLTPGVRIASEPYRLLPAMAIQLQAAVDFARFQVSSSGASGPDAVVFPSFSVKAVFANPNGDPSTNSLFQYTDLADPTSNASLGAAEVGFGWETGTSAPLPFFQLRRVSSGAAAPQDPYDFDAFTRDKGHTLALLATGLLSVYDSYQPDADTPLADYIRKQQHLDVLRPLVATVQALLGASNPGEIVQRIEGLAQSPPDSLAATLPALLALFRNGVLKDVLRTVPGISCDDKGRMFTFAAFDALAFSLGMDDSGALAIQLKPEIRVNSLRVGLTAGISVDTAKPASPGFSLRAVAGLAPEILARLSAPALQRGPEITGAMTVAGSGYGFSLALSPAAGSPYQVRLWPGPGFAYGDQPEIADAGPWFLGLGKDVLLPTVVDALLGTDVVTRLLTTPLLKQIAPDSTVNLGQILCDAGALRLQSRYGTPRFRFGSLSALAPLPLLSAAFNDVLADEAEIPLYKTSAGAGVDGVYLTKDQGLVGCRLKLTNIHAGADRLILQLGSWLSQETHDRNWLQASSGPVRNGHAPEPGVYLSLLDLSKGDPAFSPCLELVSVGADFSGGANKPLFDRSGYRIQRIEPRLYLRLGGRPGDTGDFDIGGAVVLSEMAIPLGPPFPTGASQSNPVAQNLLASGPAGAGEQQEAVNPAFSAVVAYHDRLYGKIFVANGTPSADGKVWLPIGRSFGPLRCRQIGLGFEEEHAKLGVGYDGSVSLAALTIDLDHLTIGIPLKYPGNFDKYDLGLAGLHVSFANGPVQISGGLSRVDVEGAGPRYDGMALIKAQDFTITGFGSYAMAEGAPSLFIFAVLHKDLGGPAFFHVTGVALGFGYNRALRLPPVEEVHAFPLVQAALDEHYLQSGPDALPMALTRLRDYIPPSRGDCWLAVGVRFTSFEMIQSFALLSVSFGHDLEIALVGLSAMSVPKGAAPGEAVAYAELALRAIVKPAEGLIAVEGRLTDKSYLFSRDCRLTGGFAFYTWFSGPNAGDFVVTLGGYHPQFVPPAHYPSVPRLAINWRVTGELSVTGEAYYALTPSCLMAGGRLCAVYQSGPIQAWFTAYAHFLLNWQPFYYDVRMGISIGVAASVRISLGFCSFTLSLRIELGVDLHLWGPPFAGAAYVNLSVISFTIRFGPGRSAPQPLVASEFIEAFLPPTQSGPPALKAAANSTPDALSENSGNAGAEVITLRITGGLIREQANGHAGPVIRVVNAHELILTAQSIVPSTTFAGLAADRVLDGSRLGIRSMGKTSLSSTLTVRLFKDVEKTPGTVTHEEVLATRRTGDRRLATSVVTSGVPDALWGPSDVAGEVPVPEAPKAETIPAAVGVRVSCEPPKPEHELPPIPIEKLKYDDLEPKPVYWMRVAEPGAIAAHGDRTIWNTIWADADVNKKRTAVLDILARESPFELSLPSLELLSKSKTNYFQAEPEYALVERYGAVAV